MLRVDAVGEDGANVGVGYDRRKRCMRKKQETEYGGDTFDHDSS